MRRAVMCAALTAALLTGGAGGLPESSENTRLDHLQTVAAGDANRGEWRWDQCRFARYDGERGIAPDEVRRILRCASRRWAADLDLAFRIVGCESGFIATAQNRNSSAGGVWQAIDGTWASWKARFALFMDRWSLSGRKHNGRTNGLLGFRILSEDGTQPWNASAWCWG